MTDKRFIAIWNRIDLGDNWSKTPESIFWARSYKMSIDILIEMSKDFMMLENIPDGSSKSLAHNVLTIHNKDYRDYGIAGLYK